eukprot:1926310-Karenia_brevis.AAC.1
MVAMSMMMMMMLLSATGPPVEPHVLLADTSKLLANARGWPSLDLVNRTLSNYVFIQILGPCHSTSCA